MKTRRRMPPLLSALCIVASASIVATYWYRWGGPGSNKNAWDWLQLLILPFVLVLLAIWFNIINRKNDREIAADQLHETALHAYLDTIAGLLLEKGLRASQAGDEVWNVAHVRTVTLLAQLDTKRKVRLIQFLCESQLIGVVDLSGADLSKIDLHGATLGGATLSKTNLSETNLSKADLSKANLSGANLIKADLRGAYLSATNLSYAILSGANLNETNVSGANLSKADLSYTTLSGANLMVADLSRADLSEANLTGARLSGANLNGTDLSGADLSGANLKSTYLSLEQITKAKGIQEYIEEPQS